MKMTLLQMTQSILRSIKGEEVNSITDTEESTAVADIIREAYYSMISTQDFPELGTLFSLTASGDNTKPVLMTTPNNIASIVWVRYNRRTNNDDKDIWQNLIYMDLQDYLDKMTALNPDDSNVGTMSITVDTNTYVIYYRNDVSPRYFTSYDDKTLLFDAYDSAVSATLEQSKTSCYGYVDPTWTVSDSFTPLLDGQQFDILLKDAKAMAWQEIKSITNQEAIRAGRFGRIKAEAKKHRVNYKNAGEYWSAYPNYGRK